MLDTYEGSAVMAESEERIGAPVADYAAGQQAPASAIQSAFENLENVVTHNLEYPDARVKLGADDAQVLMEDFIAGSPEVNKPMTEDGRIKTFSEMSDEEIMVRLPDYLASGMSSSGINNAMIEEAQAVMAEACMSEEELEASPDPRTPRGRELRDRKLLELAREAHEDAQKQIEAHQKKWDSEMHKIGGHEYSGADLHKINTYLLDEGNADEIEQSLMDKYGISRDEAKKRRTNLQDLAKLTEKERNGEQLTPEELKRKKELEEGQAGQDYVTVAEARVGVTGQKYNYTNDAQTTGQLTTNNVESGEKRASVIGADKKAVTEAQATQTSSKQGLFTIAAADDDFGNPVIKAEPLRPAFAKAEAATTPLDSSPQIKTVAPRILVAAAPVQQLDGTSF